MEPTELVRRLHRLAGQLMAERGNGEYDRQEHENANLPHGVLQELPRVGL
jgi:hypothetical protein